jgi:aminopeptidase C
VRSLGTTKLSVKVGKASYRKTVLLDFVVVDTDNWPYNALLGRPFLNKAMAVTATYALIMKSLMVAGVGVVKGSQKMAWRANLSVYRDGSTK